MTTPDGAPVRIGLVGYGFGGRYFHAPLLASAGNVDFVGVLTRSPGRRAELAHEHPQVRAFDSLADLVAAGAEAVAISTPVDTHVPLAVEALRLGLAVLVDKPFARTADQARQVVRLAESSGLLLTVYQNRRWDSDLRTLRRLIDDGSLGTVTRFESRFERYAPIPGPPASGGGTLLDFGAHLVDQARLLFGPVRTVYAELHARDDLGGLDDDVFVALRHAGGVGSLLWGSWVAAAAGPRLRVTGTSAAYVVGAFDTDVAGGIDIQEELLVAGHTPASLGSSWGSEPAARHGQLWRDSGPETVPSERGRWDLFYPMFARAVRGAAPAPVDPWDAVATMEVLDAARASAESGQVVTLDG